jgi:putative ABC transport system ATP-binding protein
VIARDSVVLSARNLEKWYTEGPVRVHAVRGINLTATAGSVVVLMGPSGSGKTTLLSMLGCLLTPSGGELQIMGKRVVWQEPDISLVRRYSIGFIFQHYNLLSSLTAAENVRVALKFRRVQDDARQARVLLERFGLGHRWNFLPKDLSGGEKQRVAIARALAGNPGIILADEPTGNLDSTSGRVVSSLLKEMATRENRLIVIVSHDTRILEFADEVHFLEDGILTGSPTVPREAEAYGAASLKTAF